MAATAAPPVPPAARGDERLIPLKVQSVLLALVLAITGFICYGIGTNHGTGTSSPDGHT